MNFTRRHILAALLAFPAAGAVGQAAGSGELLTKEQEARLKKFLPATFPKLQRRDPVFVAVCGDEISAFYQPGATPSRASHVMAWYGRFLDRLGAAFFYHGGVMDLNPPTEEARQALKKQWEEYRKLRAEWEKTKKGDPPKLPGLPGDGSNGLSRDLSANDILRLTQMPDEHLLSRSTFFADNYCETGAVGVQVFDPLFSNVFRTEVTDLVVIAYGARDALEGASLATFRTALEAAVAECRKKGADVILAGPPPALDEADERAAIGRSRPWAAVMREVAQASGVFFADLGAAALYQPSDLLNRTVASAFRAAAEPVRKMFDHGPKTKDGLHPNAAAHLRMGEATADWLLNGEPVRPFEISGEFHAGNSKYGENALIVRVARPADQPLTIALCPLRFTGWSVKQGTPDRVHSFEPGRGARLFRFEMVPNNEPSQGHEEFIRGSAIVSDDDAQYLVDVKATMLPLAMLWPEQRIDGASGDCLLKCTMVNTGKDELNLSLTLDWLGKQTAVQEVKIGPGDRQAVPVRLPLPPVDSAFRFKHSIVVSAAAGGHTWKFTRRIEGVRHAGLQQKLPLVSLAHWRGNATPEGASEEAGPSVTVQAHPTGIFFLVDVPAETGSATVEGKPWGRLEVQIDGRPAGENGTLGCVGSVVIEVPHESGRCHILPVRSFAFGRFYPYVYEPVSPATGQKAIGFISSVTVQPDGGRRIEFNMKRSFLPAHGWSLDGSGQSDLGINLRLFLFDANTGGYSEARTFVLTASSFPPADARSLTLLELRATPAARWSLRTG